MIKAAVIGLVDFRRSMQNAMDVLDEPFDEMAESVADRIRFNAPHRTGALKLSIKARSSTTGSGRPFSQVRSGAKYSIFVNHDTKYFDAGLQQSKREIDAFAERRAEKAVSRYNFS